MHTKPWKTISYVLITLAVILVVILTLSAYIKWEPPMSVLLVLFRMTLQITLPYVIAILFIVEIAYLFIYIVHKKQTVYGIVLYVATMLCLILNIVSFARIKLAKSDQSGISYEQMKAGTGKESYSLTEIEDYAKQLQVAQCTLYWDVKSSDKETCIIYLNYGGWSAQDESFGTQVMKFCEKEGYSFVRLAAERGANETILQLVQKTDVAIRQLLEREKFGHVYLCGGSAGGHMALLCANKEAGDDNFPVEGLSGIDGIIAFYPCVDPGNAYDYFVHNAAAKQGILGRLGDLLYCSLYQGDTGTFAGETKKLDESVFEIRNEEHSYYDTTAIKNCLNKKDIPTLIVQGSLDSMVSVPATRELVKVLKEQGKTVAYLELPGVEHVFDMMPTVAWSRCEEEITGFIRKNTKNN